MKPCNTHLQVLSGERPGISIMGGRWMAGDDSCCKKRFLREQLALSSRLPLRRNIRLWKGVANSLRSKPYKGRKTFMRTLSCSLVCREGAQGLLPPCHNRRGVLLIYCRLSKDSLRSNGFLLCLLRLLRLLHFFPQKEQGWNARFKKELLLTVPAMLPVSAAVLPPGCNYLCT